MKRKLSLLLICALVIFTLAAPFAYADDEELAEEPPVTEITEEEQGGTNEPAENPLEQDEAVKELQEEIPEEEPEEIPEELMTSGLMLTMEEPAEYPVHIGETGYNTLAAAVEAAQDGDEIVLIGDVDMDSQLTVSKNITITDDGAGRTIYLHYAGGKGIVIEANVTLGTLSGNLVICGRSAEKNESGDYYLNGGSLIHVKSGSLTTTNVTVTDAKADENGGVLYINSGSSAILRSGTVISSCISKSTGGCAYVGGTLEMEEGARIEGCQTGTNGGGVYVISTGTFIMRGGEITGCTAGSAGDAVYVLKPSGSFTMSGGTISALSGRTVSTIGVGSGSAEFSGGTVNGTLSNSSGTVSISGGTFGFDPSDYLAAEDLWVSGADPWRVKSGPGFTGTNNLNVSSDLKFGFFVTDPKNTADLKAVFTMAGSSKEVTEYTEQDGKKCFVFDGISPQYLGSKVKAELYADGEKVDEFTRSILDYVEDIYADDENSKYRPLIRDLVDYGIASNAYVKSKGYPQGTDYSRSDCAGWLPVEPVNNAVPGTDSKYSMSKAVSSYEDFTFIAANVLCDVTNTLYVRFKMPEGEGNSFYVGQTEIQPGADLIDCGNGEYIYYYRGLKAYQYTDKFEFSLRCNGEVVRTLSYGIGSYAYSKMNDGSASAVMKNLALAMYRYGASAKALHG